LWRGLAPCVNQSGLHVTRQHDVFDDDLLGGCGDGEGFKSDQCDGDARHLRSERLSPAVKADGDLAYRIASLEHGDAFRSPCERQDEGGPGAQRA
jgi:hypothetical protein